METFGGIKGAGRSEVELELRRQSYGVESVARVAGDANAMRVAGDVLGNNKEMMRRRLLCSRG